MQGRYSQREMHAVLHEAARQEEGPAPALYSADEIEQAAAEAGIGTTQLTRAMARVEMRRSFPWLLVLVTLAGLLVASAALLLPALSHSRASTVLLHNEHRDTAYRVEVLVPSPSAPFSCDEAPELRVAAQSYCSLREVWLEPRRRLRVEVPQRPDGCAQIWVRTRTAAHQAPVHSALFVLPSAVEIDRRGRLDQKGIGAPHMFPPPSDGAEGPAPRCDAARGARRR